MPPPARRKRLFLPWVYDMILWLCALAIDIFFREIQPRSAWRVPKQGPLIIVAGPHANQFVDSIILMEVLKAQAGRRISFLIAEKSMNEPYIGTLASLFGALPVARAMDNMKPAKGWIYIREPDPCTVHGINTDFTAPIFMPKGTIVFPRIGKEGPATAIITEILDATRLRIRQPVNLHCDMRSLAISSSDDVIPPGVKINVAPHIDQTQVFDAASDHLLGSGCIGIFPEGGSHDRTQLLPLKAGVAIMALNTLIKDPDCSLSIVPCGMNYFHAHKFRSRAVIEFGPAIDVHPDQIRAYKAGGAPRRDAISSLLETINQGLTAVTQQSPDYETTLLLQVTRRLYNPVGKKLPLSAVVELDRRLIKGYMRFQDNPKVLQLKQAVQDYNLQLRSLGIKDHQVEWGDTRSRPWGLTFSIFIQRVMHLFVLASGVLPGLLLFWPVFVLSKRISMRKQEKALAASVVKLRGRDVVSTWKLLVSAGLAPTLYLFYTAVATIWLHMNRTGTHIRSTWYMAGTYVSDVVPLWTFSIIFLSILLAVTFAALRFGEVGMDIVKSLPPLVVALNPWTSSTLVRLRAQRTVLAEKVKDVVNELSPDMLKDFNPGGLTADPYVEAAYQSQLRKVVLEDSVLGSVSSLDDSGFDITSAFNFSSQEESDKAVDQNSIRNAMRQRGRVRSRSFRTEETD